MVMARGTRPPPPPRSANGRAPAGAAGGRSGGGGAQPASGQTRTGARYDPLANFQFKVDLGSPTGIAMFSECSGLELNVKYDEIKEGGQNNFVHRLPTRVEYGNLVLKRGTTTDTEFFDWCSAALRGSIQRRLVTVTLTALDTAATVFAWTFVDAYPVKWSGPSLKASDSTVAIETLELAHRGLQSESQ
jgi:phage tail-like protein